MATFNAINKMPGVFIQEIDVPGPIAGVSTSIAAFIGPARTGPILEPVRVTNFTQFANRFGLPNADGNLVPYFAEGGVFAPHAVRGFFDNGGQTCYFVRVSRARRASRTLNDRAVAPRPALVVRARTEGAAGNAITVQVQDASIATGRAVVRATSNLTSALGTLATFPTQADADRFSPGDIVLLSEGATNERATVAGVSATTPTVTLTAPLANPYTAAGTMRIADLAPGQRTFRLDDVMGIEAGSALQVTDGTTPEVGVVQSVNSTVRLVTLTNGLTTPYPMAAADPAVTAQTLEFTLTVAGGPGGSRTVPNLSMDPRHSRYVISTMAAAATDVDVLLPVPPSPTAPPDNRPAVLAATALQNGSDENIAGIGPADYDNGLAALREVDEVSIVAIPDQTNATVQGSLIAHCQAMADRFAILDPPVSLGPTEIQAHRGTLVSDRGYAALYYPRIIVPNPLSGEAGQPATLLVPPSGHVAGVYARTDEEKGVHKAPANERLDAVVDVERIVTDVDHGLLNETGVNVIRFFRGRGHRVWGARTIAPQTRTQWRYVNVRRLLLFIEESIQEGTEFAVFEPNNEALWETVKRQVTGFLTRVWRSGALVGTQPDEAFRVKVDEELNPPETRALGQLIIEVRVAPTTPAEFIVFQIIQEPGKKIIDE
jgi:phage tail sheath protein FI